jgi:hypothetical protein
MVDFLFDESYLIWVVTGWSFSLFFSLYFTLHMELQYVGASG